MKPRSDQKLMELAGLPLFAQCKQRELVSLAKAMDLSWAPAGALLEVEGERSRWWKVIVHGTVSVTQEGWPTGLMGPGDWWGERSVISGGASSVTVVALTPVALLTLDRRSFMGFPGRHPLVAARIISQLAARPAPYEGLAVA